MAKADSAFRTIGELSHELGVAQHILRYWEQRFPQLRPLQRAGNRRYYRPADVELVRTIDRLLNREGYTVRGVQQLLGAKGVMTPLAEVVPVADDAPVPTAIAPPPALASELRAIRDALVAALDRDTE